MATLQEHMRQVCKITTCLHGGKTAPSTMLLGGEKKRKMEGMTLQQYCEIVEFVQKHHKFGYVGDKSIVIDGHKYCLLIKYIDSVYDSRTQDVWSVSFRGLSPNITFASNHFNSINLPPKGFKYNNLYDWVMAYLKGEWNDSKIIKDMTRKYQ